jgi:hypothetical protein
MPGVLQTNNKLLIKPKITSARAHNLLGLQEIVCISWIVQEIVVGGGNGLIVQEDPC